ncbi:hypothetical protein NZD89_08950 [Alicyclobacillus fastidiosus]|uniref:ABM domain-containing protein n=2 Tax=Alicyclobacillus fastidiosus TaxID=392011 RepID=A0ABY6ZKM9_9BACL|nr:hypothetical protein [Alicyclobacillus fastidiosus]WAH43489.1 hypothetical protein NZD89_08950 [Alicyclobacillus fastidiosus]GMA59648.1 hypothetical protein GCM10025859_00880 [Alicyclobacillus fastidiosus]
MHENPDTNVVIVAYRPLPGHEEETRALLNKHVPTLRTNGLITEQETLLLQSQDGTFLEIFEWNGPEAAKKAHENAQVRETWGEMEKILEITTLSTLPEANKRFAPFRRG